MNALESGLWIARQLIRSLLGGGIEVEIPALGVRVWHDQGPT
jgi:hypothetical protein